MEEAGLSLKANSPFKGDSKGKKILLSHLLIIIYARSECCETTVKVPR